MLDTPVVLCVDSAPVNNMATLYPDVEAAVEPVKEDLPAQAPPSNSAGEPPLPVATRAQASGGASPGAKRSSIVAMQEKLMGAANAETMKHKLGTKRAASQVGQLIASIVTLWAVTAVGDSPFSKPQGCEFSPACCCTVPHPSLWWHAGAT